MYVVYRYLLETLLSILLGIWCMQVLSYIDAVCFPTAASHWAWLYIRKVILLPSHPLAIFYEVIL